MTRLYLAGPMTGIKYFNAPAFADAAFRLRLVGYEVFNPAENDIANGIELGKFDGTEKLSDHGFSLRDILKQDLSWICDNAEGIAVLYGWEKSRGAQAEIALANALDINQMTVSRWISLAEADTATEEAA